MFALLVCLCCSSGPSQLGKREAEDLSGLVIQGAEEKKENGGREPGSVVEPEANVCYVFINISLSLLHRIVLLG